MKGSCHCKLDCATVVAYTHSEANGIHKNVLHVVPHEYIPDHMRARLVSCHEYHPIDKHSMFILIM